MRRKRVSLKSVPLRLAALCLLSQAASAQVDFRQTVAFGDSLTHNDVLGYVYKTPREWYGADPLEAVFLKGARRGDRLMSYAIAGSESRHIFLQLRMFNSARGNGHQGRPTLINFEVGANDIFGNEALLAAHPPGSDPAADGVVDALLLRTYQALLWLWRSNRQARFIVWTIPDVTQSPGLLTAYSHGERTNIRAHIVRANDYIHRLDEVPLFAVVDVFAGSQDIALSPPVIQGAPLLAPPSHGGEWHLFADPTHPSAVGNALIANAIIGKLNAKWGAGIPYYSERELALIAGLP